MIILWWCKMKSIWLFRLVHLEYVAYSLSLSLVSFHSDIIMIVWSINDIVIDSHSRSNTQSKIQVGERERESLSSFSRQRTRGGSSKSHLLSFFFSSLSLHIWFNQTQRERENTWEYISKHLSFDLDDHKYYLVHKCIPNVDTLIKGIDTKVSITNS